MKHISLILGLILILGHISYSQISISGQITDAESGKPLPLVNIYLPEQNTGTLSQENGTYIIKNIARGDIKLQFSYVGYKTIIQSIESTKDLTNYNIAMEKSVLQAEEVVVSGGVHTSQHANAIKIDLISSEEIAMAGNPGFIETLSKIPGVDMISKGNAVAKPVIRGLSMSNILVLNNGVKLENFQFSENHPFLIDEFGIDRIEVIKGPASLLYGSDAVGGVINILHEKPAPVGHIHGDVQGSFLSNTMGTNSSLGLKGSSEKLFWSIRAGTKTHMDYLDGNGYAVPNTRFNEDILKTCLGYNAKSAHFRLFYYYNQPKLGMSVGAALPYITDNEYKNRVWYQDLTSHLFISKNTFYLKQYKLDFNAAWQMNNRKLQTDETTPAFEMVNMQLNTFSYDLKMHLPSSETSEYIIGIQGALKSNKNGVAPEHVIPDAEVNDISGFALYQHSFGKIHTQAGLRYDFRQIHVEGQEDHDANIDRNYGNISGSAGGTWHLKEHILLRINFASAYRTPNLAELTQDGAHGVRFEQGNPDLNSQRNYEADISMHFHSDFLMIDLAGFYNQISRYIYLAPTNDTSSTGAQVFRYTQSDAVLYGCEISLDILPMKWLDIKSTYSYIIGQQDNGNYLPFIPQNKIKTDFIFKKQGEGRFTETYLKLGGTYAFAQNNPSPDEMRSKSWLLLNASLGSKIKLGRQFVDVALNAHNIFNELYIDHLSTLREMGYYNMGRNISVSIHIPFHVKDLKHR
jgi:iron complex outermembrane receptor protein